MTYEERQQTICKECNPDNVGCAYKCRGMTCPRLDQMMDGWELGYKDAIEKASLYVYHLCAHPNVAIDGMELEKHFKEYMEEQQ